MKLKKGVFKWLYVKPKEKESKKVKEILKKLEFESIERNKKLLGEKLILNDLSVCQDILKLNRIILDIIKNEKNELKILKKLEKKETVFVKKEILDDKKSNKVLKGMLGILPKTIKDSISLKHYVNKGAEGLKEIENKLTFIENLDIEKIKITSLITTTLKEMRKIVEKENKLIRKTISYASLKEIVKNSHLKMLETIFSKRIFYCISAFSRIMYEEITEYDNILRELYQKVKLADESGNVNELVWLEDKEIKLIEEFFFFIKQYDIPKINFPSGKYAFISCSVADAMNSLKEKAIEMSYIYVTELIIANDFIDTEYAEYLLNDFSSRFTTSENEVGFLFPLETLLYNPSLLTADKVLVFNRPSKLQTRYEDFELYLKEIENRYKEWIDEAYQLDKKFRKSWKTRAEKIVLKDFSKRWLQEIFPFFKSTKNIAQFILLKIYEKEDILRMNRMQLKKAVEKAKKLYEDILKDYEFLVNNAGMYQNTENAIFVAPSNYVLFWEKFFKSIGERPSTYYYKGSNIKTMKKEWLNCKKNKRNKKFKKPRKLKIYEKTTKKEIVTYL